jgi:hypothetical protein
MRRLRSQEEERDVAVVQSRPFVQKQEDGDATITSSFGRNQTEQISGIADDGGKSSDNGPPSL